MPVSWNDIRNKAILFSREWADETREAAAYQTFWDDFFDMFGIRRRTLARYQERVDLIKGSRGYIDLFWPGVLIAEHKTAGESLDSAYEQAGSYFDALSEDNRPRYIMVTDYRRIRFYDLEAENGIQKIEFSLHDLSKHIRLFGFIAGYQQRAYKEEDPINVRAIKAIGKLVSALAASNYPSENLPKLLVRLVFCFFADDTGIFPKDAFREYLQYNTRDDGSDFGRALGEIFQTLNTSSEHRQTTLNEDLAVFPYVNGGLFGVEFSERTAFFIPAFDREMRQAVIAATAFDWGAVSPAVFGSMFQSVMDEKARHDLGAYYTSEKNILKIVEPLFLDDLKAELASAGASPAKLEILWQKLASLKLLDPACGCGNFLVISYRELRRLEHEIIRRLHGKDIEARKLSMLTTEVYSKLHVSQMYGIEIEEFPAEIAQLSLWLADHQMNQELSDIVGQLKSNIPLVDSPHIIHGNALALDWENIVPKSDISYILGNPPFVGSKIMSENQHIEIISLFGKAHGAGTLDYVSGWYHKAAEYIQGTKITCAFVSTNSITQGEQVGALWEALIPFGIKIHFAHRTFKWTNEAPGRAGVYCVIIGFAAFSPKRYRLFDYDDIRGDPHEIEVKSINAYLVDGPDILIRSRSESLFPNAPVIGIGNKPIDGGFYLFTKEEKEVFTAEEPLAEPLFRRWLGADEFLNGYERWCLLVSNCSPEMLHRMPLVMRRVEAVRQFRLLSKSAPTKKLAETPTRFHVENIPKMDYLLIPRVSSERRHYIPIGFIHPDTLSSDSVHIIQGATLYHFGVLESKMHMAWMRAVCGRLENRYRYSKDIVYNNFPWPENPSAEKIKAVEQAAQAVLDARAQFPKATLADLYDPNTMPKALLDAHHALDRAVDACYGTKKFSTESARLEFLFNLYAEYLLKINERQIK